MKGLWFHLRSFFQLFWKICWLSGTWDQRCIKREKILGLKQLPINSHHIVYPLLNCILLVDFCSVPWFPLYSCILLEHFIWPILIDEFSHLCILHCLVAILYYIQSPFFPLWSCLEASMRCGNYLSDESTNYVKLLGSIFVILCMK